MPPPTLIDLAAVNIAEQSDLATPNHTWERTVPFLRTATPIQMSPQDDRQQDVIGDANAWGVAHPPARVANLTTLNIPMPLDANEVLLPLRAGLVGGVVGAQIAGGVDGYTYTFTPRMDLTGRADPDFYTVQYVERGAVPRTINVPKCFATNIGITIPSGDGLVQMTAAYQGGKADPTGGAAASGLSIGPRALCPKRAVGFSIHDTWAAAVAATSEASAAVSSGSISLPTGLALRDVVSSNLDLDYDYVDFTRIGEGATCNLSIYADTSSSGLDAEELVHKDAGDIRYLKFFFRSSAPQLSLAGGAKFTLGVDVIMAMRHTTDSLQARGSADGQGRQTLAMNFVSAKGSAPDESLQVVVRNGVSAYPA